MTRYVRYHKPPVPWYALRVAEALVLFLMIRSLLGLLRGPQPEQPINPFSGYVDGELLALTRDHGPVLAAGLADHGESAQPRNDRSHARSQIIKDVAEAQANSRQSLISLILIIGGGLTFFAALIRIYLRTNNQTELAAHTACGTW